MMQPSIGKQRNMWCYVYIISLTKNIPFFSLTLQGLSLMTEVNYIKTHFQKQFMNRKLYLKSLRNALNGN